MKNDKTVPIDAPSALEPWILDAQYKYKRHQNRKDSDNYFRGFFVPLRVLRVFVMRIQH